MHKASKDVQKAMRSAKSKWKNYYILKMDVTKYFQNIDKRILWEILKRKMKDKKLLWLTKEILLSTEGMVGLPLGNYTSQMFANIYLNELDQYVKHKLKCKYYYRYMDDMVIMCENKEIAKDILNNITKFLKESLKLTLNSKTRIFKNIQGVNFCGYKINDKWDVAVALNESFIAVDGEFYNTFTFEPYARYTFAKTGIASFFVDGGIGVGASGFEGDDVFGDSRFNFYLGFRPGVNIALSQKVGMVAKLGFIGYEFVDDAYHTFGINLNNSLLTFGMYYNF